MDGTFWRSSSLHAYISLNTFAVFFLGFFTFILLPIKLCFVETRHRFDRLRGLPVLDKACYNFNWNFEAGSALGFAANRSNISKGVIDTGRWDSCDEDRGTVEADSDTWVSSVGDTRTSDVGRGSWFSDAGNGATVGMSCTEDILLPLLTLFSTSLNCSTYCRNVLVEWQDTKVAMLLRIGITLDCQIDEGANYSGGSKNQGSEKIFPKLRLGRRWKVS